jgi:hypothetical protein
MPAIGSVARSERIQVRAGADGTAGMARRPRRRRRAMPAGAAPFGAAGMPAGAAPFGAAGMRWSPTHQHLRWTVTAKKFFRFFDFFRGIFVTKDRAAVDC